MAMLQRSQLLRSCNCNVQSSTRDVVRVGSMPQLRRLSVPSALITSTNKLSTKNPRPLGYGQILSSIAVQDLRQKTVVHSFLGVGAPEAILVAVVALVVFGPKGLADAAKSLGQTLRAFQPTIREVVEVSQEIKGTLEQELGIDEIRQAASMRPTPRPIRTEGSSSTDEAATTSSSSSILQPVTEQQAKVIDPEIELKRAVSEQAAWGGQQPVASVGSAAAATATVAAAAGGEQQPAAAGSAKDLSKLSLEELEAELARRKKAQA